MKNTTTSVEAMTCSVTPALSVDGEDEPPVVVAIPGSSNVNDSAHTHLQLSDGRRRSSPVLACPDDHNSTPFVKIFHLFLC